MGVGSDEREAATQRHCGECSLCCVVLRVDELGKLGGTPCRHQLEQGGCSVYASRPGICRRYRCLWLRGWFGPEDRPDRLGAVLDLDPAGGRPRLAIREGAAGAFDRSARLQEIAEDFRELMPVRIGDSNDVMNPDRPFRVLLSGGEEHRVAGEVISIYRDGRHLEDRRLPWLERFVRRMSLHFVRRRLRRAHVRAAAAALLLPLLLACGRGRLLDADAFTPPRSGRERVERALAPGKSFRDSSLCCSSWPVWPSRPAARSSRHYSRWASSWRPPASS